jgi:hypothetical protein
VPSCPEPSRGPSPDPACGGATLSPQAGRGWRASAAHFAGVGWSLPEAVSFTTLYLATLTTIDAAHDGRRFRLLPAGGEKVPEGRMRGGRALS